MKLCHSLICLFLFSLFVKADESTSSGVKIFYTAGHLTCVMKPDFRDAVMKAIANFEN